MKLFFYNNIPTKTKVSLGNQWSNYSQLYHEWLINSSRQELEIASKFSFGTLIKTLDKSWEVNEINQWKSTDCVDSTFCEDTSEFQILNRWSAIDEIISSYIQTSAYGNFNSDYESLYAGLYDEKYIQIKNYFLAYRESGDKTFLTQAFHLWLAIKTDRIDSLKTFITSLRKVISVFVLKLSKYKLNLRQRLRNICHFLFKNLDDESSLNYLLIKNQTANNLFLSNFSNEKKRNNKCFK